MMPQARVAAPGALCLSDNRRMPLARLHDPIVAIATAPGRGAVGIVRVSGPDLKPLAQALLGQVPAPRHALYGPFREADGALIDHGLALYFPAPHSYTGEDVLELQAHGGPVVLQLLLARCLSAGAALGWALRLAEPGEFTQRAFLNDKLDLAQAEAVADLIDASTEAAARSATRSLAGAFSQEIEALAERIVTLRMLVEATLDFPEEEIDFLEKADARGKLRAIQTAVDAVLGRARQGALLREGLRVVLAGQPNVGKSSLLNALAGAELAIVTPIAGTTRDRVSETIQIEGVPIHITDTAGLRDDAAASDEVERIGMARSWESIASADAVLFLHDLTRLRDADYQAADALIALCERDSSGLGQHLDVSVQASMAWTLLSGTGWPVAIGRDQPGAVVLGRRAGAPLGVQRAGDAGDRFRARRRRRPRRARPLVPGAADRPRTAP